MGNQSFPPKGPFLGLSTFKLNVELLNKASSYIDEDIIRFLFAPRLEEAGLTEVFGDTVCNMGVNIKLDVLTTTMMQGVPIGMMFVFHAWALTTVPPHTETDLLIAWDAFAYGSATPDLVHNSVREACNSAAESFVKAKRDATGAVENKTRES